MITYIVEMCIRSNPIEVVKFTRFRECVNWIYDKMWERSDFIYGCPPAYKTLYDLMKIYGSFPVVKPNVSYNSIYRFNIKTLEIELE